MNGIPLGHSMNHRIKINIGRVISERFVFFENKKSFSYIERQENLCGGLTPNKFSRNVVRKDRLGKNTFVK